MTTVVISSKNREKRSFIMTRRKINLSYYLLSNIEPPIIDY